MIRLDITGRNVDITPEEAALQVIGYLEDKGLIPALAE